MGARDGFATGFGGALGCAFAVALMIGGGLYACTASVRHAVSEGRERRHEEAAGENLIYPPRVVMSAWTTRPVEGGLEAGASAANGSLFARLRCVDDMTTFYLSTKGDVSLHPTRAPGSYGRGSPWRFQDGRWELQGDDVVRILRPYVNGETLDLAVSFEGDMVDFFRLSSSGFSDAITAVGSECHWRF